MGKAIEEFPSKVVGITKENEDGTNRQDILKKWFRLDLIRDPDNPYSRNAIKVCLAISGDQIGYIPEETSKEIAKDMDEGATATAEAIEITGGSEDKPTLGCNIKIIVDRSTIKEIEPQILEICPYCGGELKKPPQSKKKCPHCKKHMYVRSHPKLRKRMLCTEQQAKEIEELWQQQYQQ